MAIQGIDLEAGFITVDGPSGPPVRTRISELLRAADIPVGLTHNQVKGVSLIGNLVAILIRTLIDREILSESFLEDDGYSLDDLIYAIEQLGGSYSDPHFDDVEEA